ncbi:VIT1/CCC1 transporter family protein [Candidatus Micrarchaeota archaeon]|nr:VIT1/CCC1 transporter family protein [Candidatus Micrarchaeota archaeon]
MAGINFFEHFQGIAFGLMDGIVTLLGILIGVSEATGNAKIVIVSGLIGGIANSFGNAIGFYTSESAERGMQLRFYEKKKKRDGTEYLHTHSDIIQSALLSFFSSLLALFIPTLPFFLVDKIGNAMVLCVVLSISLLFFLGYYIGSIYRWNAWKSGIRYVLIGLIGAAVGFLAGDALKHLILGA